METILFLVIAAMLLPVIAVYWGLLSNVMPGDGVVKHTLTLLVTVGLGWLVWYFGLSTNRVFDLARYWPDF